MLDGVLKQRYETLQVEGMNAKDDNENETALFKFEEADRLAVDANDGQKRLDALQPAARALWTLARYDEAAAKLETAAQLARELKLVDEEGMVISNLGRLVAVRTVRTVALAHQIDTLRDESVPKFKEAFNKLYGHPHLHHRLANAGHGSVVAALTGEREIARELVHEGLIVAFSESPKPYDQERTYRVTSHSISQLAIATALIPLADNTPKLAEYTRTRLIR